MKRTKYIGEVYDDLGCFDVLVCSSIRELKRQVKKSASKILQEGTYVKTVVYKRIGNLKLS